MRKFFRKKQFAIILVIILLTGFLWKKYLSPKELEGDYLFLSYYYLTHRITDPYPSSTDKIQALISYVHENIFQPVVPVKDLRPLDNLIRGVGWCDQMSALFIRFLSELDIRGYLIFLKSNPDGSGSSLHSIAVITPSMKDELSNESLYEQGMVVDNLRGILVRTKNGRVATMKDVCRGDVADQQVGLLASTRSLYCNKFEIFGTNTPISLKIKKNKFAYRFQLCSILPRSAVYAFQDFMLQWHFKHRFEKKSDFMFFKARNYHLYGRLENAVRAYDKVIQSSSDRNISGKALFFKAKVFLEMGRTDDAIAAFETLIQQYPDHPWKDIARDKVSQLFSAAQYESK